jgi:hypothetical protein
MDPAKAPMGNAMAAAKAQQENGRCPWRCPAAELGPKRKPQYAEPYAQEFPYRLR